MPVSLSPRENYLACLNHKPHEYTPGMPDAAPAGITMPIERGEGGAGTDAWGVNWVAPLSGGVGSAIPKPGEFMLTDITKWKSVVKIPDLSVYDWEAFVEAERGMYDRDMQVIEIFSSNFVYERLATLMGFEEALLAMALEPDATYELLEAILEWKIEGLKYYIKYFNPDSYIYFDDVATERVMFMAPETYRAMIKPLHTRMVQTCKDYGVIPIQHTCGNADLILDDMVEEGNAAWHCVQSQNDIVAAIEKYGDRFVIMGGYNTTGAPGQPSATEEMVRAEVRRCLETYGKYGYGYTFFGQVLTQMDPANPFYNGPMNEVILDEFLKIRAEQTA
ncbi:MAG: hypothetical protein LBU61_00630 [Coriobacteriales bacterium]|jgi:hypothetical protein|nr:hypothetical protein [Coriobacteriales bacterium]